MNLVDVSSQLFLYLVSLRRQIRNGMTPDMQEVRHRLLDIFAEQQAMVREEPRLERKYEQVRYVLYVLADEILINSNWAYADAWQDQLLEWEQFNSRLAGDEFFRLLEAGERDDDLAEIFYLALSLGFTGKYADRPEKLREMKLRLYRSLPARVTENDKFLTPEAYFVAEGAKSNYKPVASLGRILIVCLGLIVGLYFINRSMTKATQDDVDRYHNAMVAASKPPGDREAALKAYSVLNPSQQPKP